MLIVVVLEFTKATKMSVEIVFGGLLLVFVLFAKGGLVVFIRRFLPSWNETLHASPAPRSKAP